MGRVTASVLGLAAAAAFLAAPSPAQATACDPALISGPGSLIGDFWRSNNAGNSVFGCPIKRETRYANRPGAYQSFQNGQITWSPELGNGTLVRVFQKNGKVVLKWSGLGRDWDFFQVRYTRDGGPATQVKLGRITPWSGEFKLNPYVSGGVGTTTNGDSTTLYRLTVQGCDRGTFSSDCGPWSIASPVRVRI